MAVHRCPDLLQGHMVSSESYRKELWHTSPYVHRLSLSTSPTQEVSFVTSFRTSLSCLAVRVSHCQCPDPLCIHWTLGNWPSTCKLLSLYPSLSCAGCQSLCFNAFSRICNHEKYFGPFRQLGCVPNRAGTSGRFWLPRLCHVSVVLRIGVTFLKTDGQPRVWKQLFRDIEQTWGALSDYRKSSVLLLGTAEKISSFLSCSKLKAKSSLSLTPCQRGQLKQMMKIDDVIVCNCSKHEHLNSAFPSNFSLKN